MVVLGLLSLLSWPVARGGEWSTADDYTVSETPIFRTPLTLLRETGRASVAFELPRSSQWDRIRKHWGDPGFTVFAAPDNDSYYPWSTLALDVAVHRATGPMLHSDSPTLPYRRSLFGRGDYTDAGLTFSGDPGDEVVVDVVARTRQSLPQGELIVKYEWGGSQKDHIIAPPIEALFQRIGQAVFAMGVGLLAIGGAMGAFRRS
jgi:hypothetical protein